MSVPTYPSSSYQQPATRASTNGLSVASLVLGVLWIWGIGSILALIFGYISLRQIKERGEGGRGLALAGVVLGWVGVGGAVLLTALLVIAAASSPDSCGWVWNGARYVYSC